MPKPLYIDKTYSPPVSLVEEFKIIGLVNNIYLEMTRPIILGAKIGDKK
jgi:hypothetical protein